jgi:hypothetical protein
MPNDRDGHKIYTTPRIDKLGVKPDSCVSVLGKVPDDFLDELAARCGAYGQSRLKKQSDIVLLFVETEGDLKALAKLEPALARNGAVWVVYPKGRKDITQAQVMATMKAVGLTDNKVCSFSETHTGLRAVIPVARR